MYCSCKQYFQRAITAMTKRSLKMINKIMQAWLNLCRRTLYVCRDEFWMFGHCLKRLISWAQRYQVSSRRRHWEYHHCCIVPFSRLLRECTWTFRFLKEDIPKKSVIVGPSTTPGLKKLNVLPSKRPSVLRFAVSPTEICNFSCLNTLRTVGYHNCAFVVTYQTKQSRIEPLRYPPNQIKHGAAKLGISSAAWRQLRVVPYALRRKPVPVALLFRLLATTGCTT